MWKEAAPVKRAPGPSSLAPCDLPLPQVNREECVTNNLLSQTLGEDVPLTYLESQHTPLFLHEALSSLLATELTEFMSPPPSNVSSTVTIPKRPPSAPLVHVLLNPVHYLWGLHPSLQVHMELFGTPCFPL